MWKEPSSDEIRASWHSCGNSFFHSRCQPVSRSHHLSQFAVRCAQWWAICGQHLAVIGKPPPLTDPFQPRLGFTATSLNKCVFYAQLPKPPSGQRRLCHAQSCNRTGGMHFRYCRVRPPRIFKANLGSSLRKLLETLMPHDLLVGTLNQISSKFAGGLCVPRYCK